MCFNIQHLAIYMVHKTSIICSLAMYTLHHHSISVAWWDWGNHDILGQDNQSPGWNLNQEPCKYEVGVLTTHSWHLVC
jgi:hypothetical protein